MDAPELISTFDALLADLDGVVYAGPHAIPGAVESLRRLAGIGVGLGYVTNNASRTPAQVAQHLRELGAPAEDHQVVSSSQAAGELLASLLPAGARVLITGGDSLAQEIELAGLVPVRSESEQPVAVVQGFHPDLGWKDLAEAAYVIAGGALWVATNTDMSIPQARGMAPGNGTLVAAVAAATGQRPLVAGKPEAPLFHAAAKRLAADRPLVVGDRLDTDILGGNNAGLRHGRSADRRRHAGIDPRRPHPGTARLPHQRPHGPLPPLPGGGGRRRAAPLRRGLRRRRRADGPGQRRSGRPRRLAGRVFGLVDSQPRDRHRLGAGPRLAGSLDWGP